MENYRPQLFLRTADITISLQWPEGTPDASEKMVMPGDNVEMVCELVHEAAAEVGTRFTLREGGKTSKQLHPLFLTHDSYRRSQLEPVLSRSSSRQLKPFVFYRYTRLLPSVIRVRARYKNCCLCFPPFVVTPHSRKVETLLPMHTCIHTLQLVPITHSLLAMRTLVVPGLLFCGCSAARVLYPIWAALVPTRLTGK